MSWRDDYADQNLRMAQKMLEQQGEINAMRSVVKAAEKCADAVTTRSDAVYSHLGDLVAEVDAYRATQKEAGG